MAKGDSDKQKNKDRAEGKCRKTLIRRYWSKDKKSWVDVEIIVNASFRGAQWQGPDSGNQEQETTVIAGTEAGIEQCTRVVLETDPTKGADKQDEADAGSGTGSSPPSNETGSRAKADTKVEVPVANTITYEARAGQKVERRFNNDHGTPQSQEQDKPPPKRGKNTCRQNAKRRVPINNIDDEFLEEGKPADPAKGKEAEGKTVPKDAKAYKKAVYESKDQMDVWTDVDIPKQFKVTRAKDIRHQAVNFKDMYGKGNIALPGVTKKTNLKIDHMRLDPYQVVVNFGPDGLAAEFFEGAGPGDKHRSPTT